MDIRGSALAWMVLARQRAVTRRRAGHKIARLAAVFGIDPPPLPVTWTAPEDRARAAAMLPADRPVVALAPTANRAPQMRPDERFVALFRVPAEEVLPGTVPAVFAGRGKAERAMAAPVPAALPEAVDPVGRQSLPEVAACLARCSLFIGNDSGLMHLAAGSGTPTLGLFGPTDAAEYAPSGRRAHAVVSDSNRMDDLTVEQAFSETVWLLAQDGASPSRVVVPGHDRQAVGAR